MFAKLIASSVDIKKEKDVLPEFVDILKNMTKCMAEDIVYMKQHLEEKRNRFPLADIYVKTRNIFSELEFTEQSLYKLEKMDDIFYEILCRNICIMDESSFGYLLKHEIINIEEKYSPMINYDIIDEVLLPRIQEEKKINFQDIKIVYKYYYLTYYGKKFLSTIL